MTASVAECIAISAVAAFRLKSKAIEPNTPTQLNAAEQVNIATAHGAPFGADAAATAEVIKEACTATSAIGLGKCPRNAGSRS
jgi:hypothetical protein